MEYGIRGTAHGNIKGHRIHKGLAGGNAARQDRLVAILIIGKGIFHDLTGSGLEEFDTVGMGSENRTITRQTQADGLCERVHRIGCEHS